MKKRGIVKSVYILCRKFKILCFKIYIYLGLKQPSLKISKTKFTLIKFIVNIPDLWTFFSKISWRVFNRSYLLISWIWQFLAISFTFSFAYHLHQNLSFKEIQDLLFITFSPHGEAQITFYDLSLGRIRLWQAWHRTLIGVI